jgi:hypothetical protein
MSATVQVVRARWDGPDPKPGEFLLPIRSEGAYRILDVCHAETPTGGNLSGYRLHIRFVEVPAAELPADAVAHPWNFDPRTRRRGYGFQREHAIALQRTIRRERARAFRSKCKDA